MFGWVKRLFGGEQHSSPAVGATEGAERLLTRGDLQYGNSELLNVPGIGWCSISTRSPNGQAIVLYCCSKTPPEYLFVYKNKIVARRTRSGTDFYTYPSDSGRFLYFDFDKPEALECWVMVADPGKPDRRLWHLHALPYNGAISRDGRFAVVQTANSPFDEDASRLALFDLDAGALLFKVENRTGWTDRYTIDSAARVLWLHYEKRQSGRSEYSYDFAGRFREADEWERGAVDRENGFELFARVHALLAQDCVTAETRSEAIRLLRLALKRFGKYDNWIAKTWRRIGELQEENGCRKEAMRAYEQALKLDPKVGVKQRLAKMRNRVGRV